MSRPRVVSILTPGDSFIIPADGWAEKRSPRGVFHEAKVAFVGMAPKPTALIDTDDLHFVREVVTDLMQVAQDFLEVLGEEGLFCECGEPDCRTTRLRAAIKKATGE